jgi:myo-inositol 2-dehydrogenase/D-chiro-inositol 1-dehydrogenase
VQVTDARRPTRVAVVGAGVWGEQHARVFSAHPDAQLVAIAGRTRERADARARAYRVPAYVDLEAMLERERPDLVTVCLPNEEHFEPTLALLRSGVALLVEKPLVFELEQADALLAEAERQGTFFAINFNHRFALPVRMAADAVAAGRLGALAFATWRFGGEPGTSTHPHANLIETQCHGFDMLEHLCGPIEALSAELTDATGRGFSTMAIALRFANGAVGSLVGTYDSSYAYPDTHRLELNGTLGRLLVHDTVRRFELSEAGRETRELWEAGYFNDLDREFHRTFDRHAEALLAALRTGAEPPVHARAGRRALELAHAAIRSFETGRRVAVAP